MTSRSDPDHDRDDLPPGPIFVPQGPMWDAWNAPDGGAVKLVAFAAKMEARWLRRARPRPFGFAPGSTHPAPECIEEAQGAGTLSSGVASVLGFRTAVQTMSIVYGDRADPQAPAARIISDFHRDYQDRDLEESLLGAASKWPGMAAEPEAATWDKRVSASRAEVTSATADVVVSGNRRPVFMLRLREFSAFQVGDQGVLVTVLARHLGPEFADIVRLSDLEPMISVLEHPDTEVIAAALAQQRRWHIEQMRNQARHRS